MNRTETVENANTYKSKKIIAAGHICLDITPVFPVWQGDSQNLHNQDCDQVVNNFTIDKKTGADYSAPSLSLHERSVCNFKRGHFQPLFIRALENIFVTFAPFVTRAVVQCAINAERIIVAIELNFDNLVALIHFIHDFSAPSANLVARHMGFLCDNLNINIEIAADSVLASMANDEIACFDDMVSIKHLIPFRPISPT